MADLISPGDVENYDDIILEFSGFCPVALVRYFHFNIIFSWLIRLTRYFTKYGKLWLTSISYTFSGQGFVLPGNNKLGYLFYKERYYSISTVDRAEQFGRNPDLFIVAIKKLIKDSPCLLKLLNVTDEEAEEEESPSKNRFIRIIFY